MMDWHPQIHRRYAEMDGFKPSDFTWLDYPVSNVRLQLNPSRHVDVDYLADLPPETPQLNVYIEEKDRQEGVEYEDAGHGWLKIPDPVGTALAWVRFDLIDIVDGTILHTSSSPSHFDGAIQAGLSATARGVPLWERLTPGESVNVRLEACPEFFPWVDENGSGQLGYTTNSNGYFKGETVISPEYTLRMTPLPDSVLLLDGQPVRELVFSENPEDVAARLESDRIMAEEKAQQEAAEKALRRQVEEENRLHNERMDRERAELEAEQARLQVEVEEQQERERLEYEAEQARAAKARESLAGVPEYTFVDQVRDGLADKSNEEARSILIGFLPYGGEYEEAAKTVAAERNIDLG